MVGVVFYIKQLRLGLIATNLSNQVSWGLYIANFTFLVGIAASSVILNYLYYFLGVKDAKIAAMVGKIMAVSALLCCFLFILVDVGRPDKLHHMLPFLGNLNFPSSLLAWDMLALSGYFMLCLYTLGYLLWKKIQGQEPIKILYLPFVYLSMPWAICTHTVTAFLYAGLGSRQHWNTALLAPRFIASAFASGTALLLIILLVLKNSNRMGDLSKTNRYLKNIVIVGLLTHYFFIGCELFTAFYSNKVGVSSLYYMFFSRHLLTPYIWSSMILGLFGLFTFLTNLHFNNSWLVAGCLATLFSIGVEKGLGLLMPGFLPSPLGEVVGYFPSLGESLISLGIFSIGALVFTILVRFTVKGCTSPQNIL